MKTNHCNWTWFGKTGNDELDGLLVFDFWAGKQSVEMPSFRAAKTLCDAINAEIEHHRKDERYGFDNRIRAELTQMLRE